MSSACLVVGLTVVGTRPGCDPPGTSRTQLCGSSLFLMGKLGLSCVPPLSGGCGLWRGPA